MPKALIVGCSGQDGTYLSELLASKGYTVIGVNRHGISTKTTPTSIDISSPRQANELISIYMPDEVYYLAAYHHSSEDPSVDPTELMSKSLEINVSALGNFLAAIKNNGRQSRLFYAASSRVFGEPCSAMQDENTPFSPICPYGISKSAGVYLCRYYRASHDVYCSAGILYNHESPLRPVRFVSRKIVRAVVDIKRNSSTKLVLGNLEAQIDWGYAPDYVDAMQKILRLDSAGDFVIASGTLHSVREFVEIAFDAVGLKWQDYVVVNPELTAARRPQLHGNAGKLHTYTGWRPRTSFREMILQMLKVEFENA